MVIVIITKRMKRANILQWTFLYQYLIWGGGGGGNPIHKTPFQKCSGLITFLKITNFDGETCTTVFSVLGRVGSKSNNISSYLKGSEGSVHYHWSYQQLLILKLVLVCDWKYSVGRIHIVYMNLRPPQVCGWLWQICRLVVCTLYEAGG